MKILGVLALCCSLLFMAGCPPKGSIPITPDGVAQAEGLSANQVAYGLEQGFALTVDTLIDFRQSGLISLRAWNETYLPLMRQGDMLLDAYQAALGVGDLNLAMNHKVEVLNIWTELNTRSVNIREAYDE